MNRLFRTLVASIVPAVALSAVAGPASADDGAPPPPPVQRVVLEIGGLRNAKGVVRCSLFASPDGFPTNPERALMRTIAPSIASGRAVCVFDDVKPGVYAASYLHDENNNGKMDTNFLGLPAEGYGASRDARGSMGPPKWDAAKFAHDGVTRLQLKTEY